MTANPAQTPAQKAARRAVKGVGPDTDIAGNPLTDEQKATMREIEARWAREDAMTANPNPFAALAAERAKVAKLVEALTFYSCEDGCNDCSENERDLIGCGWTARAAITEAGK